MHSVAKASVPSVRRKILIVDDSATIRRQSGLAGSGFDFLEAADELTRRGLPVVMSTIEGEPKLISRAKKAGARAWIVKPLEEHLSIGAVKKLAERSA